MNLTEIISITGQSGLFKVIARHKNRMIVESLSNGKRIPAYTHQRITTLEDISIYTETDDIPLKEVFAKILEKENGGPGPESSAGMEALRNYFAGILPEYDKDRVYDSDIKKVLGWYNLLRTTDFLKEETKEEETAKEEEPPVEKPVAKTGDASKTVRKKPVAKADASGKKTAAGPAGQKKAALTKKSGRNK